jgi:hypothetical protein
MLETNPHLQRLVGLGVTDPVYRDSCWRDTGRRLAAPADLGGAIDGGTHLLVALPREAVGELQPLFAALILDTVASVVLRRKPNSSGIQTEFFLDEFSAYIPDSFGQLLAQVRKFRGTIHLYAQGSYQAPAALRDEILNNTAVKLYGITDHPGEAKAAASLTLQESSLFHALQERMFVLKVRGRAESIPLVTPTFHPRCSLLQASAIATQRTRTPTVAISQADEELAWRRQWIAEGGYRTSAAPIYLGETGPSQDSHRTGRSPREHAPKRTWDLPL